LISGFNGNSKVLDAEFQEANGSEIRQRWLEFAAGMFGGES